MKYDLRLTANEKDLECNLDSLEEMIVIKSDLFAGFITPELTQAQREVFVAFRKYLQLLKANVKPSTMIKELEGAPDKALGMLEELTIVDQKATSYDLEKGYNSPYYSSKEEEEDRDEGKRTFVEEFGDDDVSDELMTRIRSLYDNPTPDNVLDEDMVELREELDRESSPLFQFDFQPVGQPKKALNIIQKQRRVSQKKQLRPATRNDDIGQEITRGVADMARRVIEKSKSPQGNELKDNDKVTFNFFTKKFSHPLQSAIFTVAEIANDSSQFETYMQMLANQLNSNKSFDIDNEFQADMTIICEPNAGRKTNLSILGKLNMTTVLHHKHSILPFKNSEDNLCLARAICITKAHFHKDDDRKSYNKYKNLQKRPLTLMRCAKNLHREAGVPERDCGQEELKKFQEYLVPDYRLKVMSVTYPYCITFKGPSSAPLVLHLLFQSGPEGGNGHYHSCTSYSAFLERSYFYEECNRGFNTNEFRHHPCEGRRCKACKTIECGPKSNHPSLLCTHCNRSCALLRDGLCRIQMETGRVRNCFGRLFGDMTNELDEGDYIMEFISAGAKNYGYITAQGKSCVKVKGFPLNAHGMAQLNYEVMKQNILDEIQHPLDEARKTEIVNSVHFVQDPVKKKIRTETHIKSYRLVFDKRVVDNGTFTLLPYG
ncbi:hypothetical protein AWC38_SpisGene8671 [Stylophora pistillata]|uniref:Uncharacterized protein n=1 Tax=Stylophora pistillata TaxID=50429 RepID=A0A2B4SDJ4_STYPI|nr:hypothetical protein AWC38_SpisGene8671 [Stylophora pistillata]